MSTETELFSKNQSLMYHFRNNYVDDLLILTLVCGNLCEKRKIGVSEPHFGVVRTDTRSLLMARWKVHGRLSIRFN